MADYRLPPLPEAALPEEVKRLLDGVTPGLKLANAAALAWDYSPFLRSLMRRRDDTLRRLAEAGPDVALTEAFARLDGEAAVAKRMRQAKADVALIAGLADMAGLWPLEIVTRALSDLADRTLDLAVAAAVAERAPGADPKGFAVLGLGKLGSHELNYSSDVDLILLHDRASLPRRERDDPDEAALRVAKRVVELMQARDGDGYVFRVDLRLRPSSEATPITLPWEAAESYYQSEALPWERAAFIRARACAGDKKLGQAFLDNIGPFVWRRSLDYTAIRDIEEISLRIRDHFDEGQEVGPGFDLKRGRGGIREVEFFAQIHQMIFGGRETGLRAPATLDALAALAAAGRIGADDAAQLGDAYRLYRTVEHRIQMRDDEQTHAVPTAAPARTALAKACGLDGWRSLERLLESATRVVAKRYDGLIARAEGDRLPRDAAALTKAFKARKFPEGPALVEMVGRWRGGSYRALRSPDAQRVLENVLPALVEALAEQPDPAGAARRLDGFLEQLPAGVQFLGLIEANPRLLGLLGRLLGVTPVLADALARTPDLFDVLLDPEAFAPLPDAPTLAEELRLYAGKGHIEDKLDRVRRWTAERRFQIGAQLIEGHADPLAAATAYAGLADAAFAVLAPAVEEAFAETHGRVAGSELLVLGLGRFGGRALTARSDLDIIFLFSGSHEGQSDGEKPLPATLYFNRLAQRLTAALSVPTAAGALYEVDTRLRPSGGQGLLAVTIDTFAAYQQQDAWTWEHMALTRARVVIGAGAARAAVERAIDAALHMDRDAEKLRTDVLAMRDEMEAHKPGTGLWDVKLGAGALVDLEFIVHYLQLRDRAAFTPDLRAACAALIEAGALPPALLDAHDLMTRLLVMLRLVIPGTGAIAKIPADVGARLAASTGHKDLAALEAALKLAKAAVLEAWEAAFGSKRRGK
ncbi:bifunctional [glutamine synthetase] adenylyltransferase/[glutamine synthetase]-adenylyl-L-tyrosine phosphorylase [Sphingoaurantiacus capsulatus]|uniref:Bifunctional [glutamine synthetase] adenylyltransferase/[glutamine synthetase]-adenylyl-L-tyrosine phosphorylase n=1 Tax=Sphingoaurantiacus capsulatus TaxID=1771310 RepID=A0ABV7XDN8_9SPHN